MSEPNKEELHRLREMEEFYAEKQEERRQSRFLRMRQVLQDLDEKRDRERRTMLLTMIVFAIIVFVSMLVHSSRVQVEKVPPAEAGVTK